MIESENISTLSKQNFAICCPYCGAEDADWDFALSAYACEGCGSTWHYDGPDEPVLESSGCPHCDGSGEVADPNDWGNWGPELIGGSVECSYCGGVGTV